MKVERADVVLSCIGRLLALGLELPEETFVEQHRFDAEGMTFRAYLAARPFGSPC